ncbi:MAG TPA: VOC family protein [Chitinophagaceae bacterium]|nr:VOC family protein [Chitinophagaceae bacterium]
MATQIFVNLPVKDLDKSKKFFTDIGFTINPQFTDEKAACVVISEDIYAMILTEEFFKTFIPNKEISDSTKSTEVLVALSAESKEKVNELSDKALAAGASKLREPDDYGFMYSRSFQDPDGHIWEVVYMDMNAVNEQQENPKHEQTV